MSESPHLDVYHEWFCLRMLRLGLKHRCSVTKFSSPYDGSQTTGHRKRLLECTYSKNPLLLSVDRHRIMYFEPHAAVER